MERPTTNSFACSSTPRIVSPRNMIGMNGGVFNFFGNLSTITTPLVIGFLVARTHSYNAALVFVGLTALMAIISYLFLVGDIRRLELTPESA